MSAAWVSRAQTGCGPASDGDGERETVNGGVLADRTEAVCRVRGDVNQIALLDLPLLLVDGHDATTGGDVVELVARVRVRLHFTASGHFELRHIFEVATPGDLAQFLRPDEPPHGNRPVMLDLLIYLLN